MSLRLVVSSNCQTAGLASTLRMVLPGSQVDPFPFDMATGDARTVLLSQLGGLDAWVVTAPKVWIDAALAEAPAPPKRVITAPDLYFDAFHPDLVYAWLPDGRTLDSASGPYNSAIALWAWQHGLTAARTKPLFTPEIFQQLGYTNRWVPAVARLKSDFDAHEGLDYRDFILPLQRSGVFMHSVNHPRINALARLGRQIGVLLGAAPQRCAEPIEDVLLDGLMFASVVWPVYPGIADALGLAGMFNWKLPDQTIIGLDEYLERSFAAYADVDPTSIQCHQLQWPSYDAVLGAATSGRV